MNTKFLLPLIAFAALVGIFVVGLQMDPSRIPSPLVNNPAPEFALPSLQDPAIQVGSADYSGQMVLVNIWATWCPGCRQEHDFLVELASEEIVPIFGLNWRDNRPDALKWLQVLGDPYMASAFDGDGRVEGGGGHLEDRQTSGGQGPRQLHHLASGLEATGQHDASRSGQIRGGMSGRGGEQQCCAAKRPDADPTKCPGQRDRRPEDKVIFGTQRLELSQEPGRACP